MPRQRHDVVIQGAGMAGLALAVALARDGQDVALLAEVRPEAWRGGDYRRRVVALNRASEALLERLGVWRDIMAQRASPVRAIEARDALGGGRVRFDAADADDTHLAHIVENDLVVAMLARAATAAGVRWIERSGGVERLEADPSLIALGLGDGRRVEASLLVGADGADSAIRGLAGIAVSERGYGQRGLVTAVRTGEPHGGVARQRFLPGGPLALLPLAEGRCSVVWSLPEAEAGVLAGSSPGDLAEALRLASDGWLGDILEAEPAAVFPLRRLRAACYIAERVVLVGDAAHVIHPLAGQGINLGLSDVAELAARIRDPRRRDPGSPSVLRGYERARRGGNALTQDVMDLFHGAFTRSDPLLVAARSAGFDLTDRLPFLRRLFMSRAMGR